MSAAGRGPVELAAGGRITLAGTRWQVREVEPHTGRVLLRRDDGQELSTTIRALVHRGDCRPAPAGGEGMPHSRGRQPAGLEDLTARQRELVASRYAHLMETETGYRGGSPLHALPGEPRPEYDPAVTTLRQRRLAKAAEMAALGADSAAVLGLARISERTLARWAGQCRRYGITGCIDGNWLRRGGERPSITEQVREAIYAVHGECLHRSRVSMATKDRLIRQYAREKFGPEADVPSYWTLRRTWAEWFGPGRARQRYARSAARLPATGGHVVIHRPGQVVALDTTPLGVKVREHVFGEPVTASLTLALDLYTHSLVAFRLTLVSDTSVDVAMLLRDVMMPLPLREDWGSDMEWPYPGIPASLVASFAGHKVAGLPFFAPETVTTDHGSVYKNHHLVEVQRVIGANILPARVLRPTDKQAVERAFSGIQSLLLEMLPGWRGIDAADRGADPEADAVLTVAQAEHLVATWIVRVWQNRELGEYAPAWDPGTRHSPNTLFAAAMSQGGFALQIPAPELYYELLPVHLVKIHGRRGVKIRGLWYDGPALDPYRSVPSPQGGAARGKWKIRREPRDRRHVYFCDPLAHDWHALRWTGLPPEGEVPSFSDLRADDLLRAARAAGLQPRSDAELLPLLLDLVGGLIPVDAWPTQMSRQQRTAQARESAQADQAAADRPAPAEPGAAAGQDGNAGAAVVPMRWRDQARDAATAVDAERRRRREQAAGSRPEPAPLMRDALRRGSMLRIPDDDPGRPQGTAGDAGQERP
ncbi:MAG TPA: transposase [Streptosporangiaceae bacterium]|nr:transposase [Streptosporangiaceae bacterium]